MTQKNCQYSNERKVHLGKQQPVISSRIMLLLLIPALLSLSSCAYYVTYSWGKKFPEGEAIQIPGQGAALASPEPPPYDIATQGRELLQLWANKTMEPWNTKSKTGTIRVMAAKLFLGQEVEAVNKFLLNLKAFGKSGSTGPFNKKGDYDFTEIRLVSLLYQFENRPDRLFPETKQHIVNKLLIDKGKGPRIRMPGTMKTMRDTENHILMKEGSRYLANQWLKTRAGSLDPAHDNEANGMEAFLLQHLQEMERTGFYEFNSNPYAGYTLSALLTIATWVESEAIAQQARRVLDLANWDYALGSLNLRQSAPMRRRLERAGMTAIDQDRFSVYFRVWMLKEQGKPVTLADIPHYSHHALTALLLPYRLPAAVKARALNKKKEYLACIGHGKRSTPEIHSGGPNWLLSAGGLQRGKASQIVPRATTLLLSDSATSRNDCFHLPGKGKLAKWNNTGVWKRFAVGNAGVEVPKQYQPLRTEGQWALYEPLKGVRIAVYNTPDLGILMLLPGNEDNPAKLLRLLAGQNPPETLKTTCRFPEGPLITYDLKAPKGKWVIKTVDGKPLNRDIQKWQRLHLEE